MTYHPIVQWTCHACNQRGEITYDLVKHSAIERWDLVLDDHKRLNPGCDRTTAGHLISVLEHSGSAPPIA